MDSTLTPGPYANYAIQPNDNVQKSLQSMSQIMHEMNQLIIPINKLNEELFMIETNTINNNFNKYYYNKVEEYNKLISEYNNLEKEYQLILTSAVHYNTNKCTKNSIKWESLSSMPGTPFSNPVKINEYEFIFAIYNEHVLLNYNSIYCYNIKTNKWREFLKYPDKFHLDPDGPIIYNNKTNELYLINGLIKDINNPWNSHPTFATVKLNSDHTNLENKWHFIESTRQEFSGSSIIINNMLHCFGGGNNRKHRIYKLNEKKEIIKNEIYDFSSWSIGNVQHGLIYISNENRILLFGGMDIPNYPYAFDTIWNYNILNKQWSFINGIRLPFKMYGFGHILSADQKCIILFGGGKERQNNANDIYVMENGYEFIDNIFVIELDRMRIRESKIICPKKGIFHAISMVNNNNILVNGFMREVGRMYGLNMCLDIYNLMNIWYKEQYIYILHRETCKHWKMDIVEIISNLKH
eukprot:290462_1